ncbi:MAG: hydantoinase B/oxoprolinase family protein [Solirubrobacterales bacterium]
MKTVTPTPSDPVRLAVLTNRMEGIVRGMLNTMYRTGRSGILNTARDVIACILTPDDEMLACAESLPIMTLSGPELVTPWLREWHPVIKAGDAFLHNSPYHGNSHSGDHSVFAPVVDDAGELRFWVCVKAHVADSGNSLPTTCQPLARDVYEEGSLIFAGVKVQSDYQHLEDVQRMCRLRLRVPELWHGDFLAMLGAVRTAERELLNLGRELGWDALQTYASEWLDYSEGRMATAIRQLPAGTATASTRYDALALAGVEQGLTISATVAVDPDDGRIEVDCRDNPDCVPCGINLTEATATAAVRFAALNSLPGDIPINGGSFRRLRILLRENCVAGIPRHPASCSMATTGIATRLTGAVQIAFAELGEGLGMAEAGGMFAASDSIISGRDPRRGGEPFVNLPVIGATGGAAGPYADGWLLQVGGSAGMMMRDSAEMDELLHPIRIDQDRLVPDTEGPGRLRGALSNYVEYGPVGTSIELVCTAESTESPAQGARGGWEAQVTHQYKRLRDGSTETVVSPSVVVLAPGESIVSYSSGGGGYGPPHDRDVAAVLDDVLEGYVSRERAKTVYGVVIDDDGEVDEAATAEARRVLASRTA